MTVKIYLVGGAVRDIALGLTPVDHDYLIVGADEAYVEQMISNGFTQVGKDFPVFLHPNTGAEYALARTERKVGPGHGGFTVETAGVTLEEDCKRRDFTINSMAIDIEDPFAPYFIIDPYNGLADLQSKTIRATSPESFKDDPLRALRAIRFACRYDFNIDDTTQMMMDDIIDMDKMDELSIERLQQELYKSAADGLAAFNKFIFWTALYGTFKCIYTSFFKNTKPDETELLSAVINFGSRQFDKMVNIPLDVDFIVACGFLHVKLSDLRDNKFASRVIDIIQTVQVIESSSAHYKMKTAHERFNILNRTMLIRDTSPTSLFQIKFIMEHVLCVKSDLFFADLVILLAVKAKMGTLINQQFESDPTFSSKKIADFAKNTLIKSLPTI